MNCKDHFQITENNMSAYYDIYDTVILDNFLVNYNIIGVLNQILYSNLISIFR